MWQIKPFIFCNRPTFLLLPMFELLLKVTFCNLAFPYVSPKYLSSHINPIIVLIVTCFLDLDLLSWPILNKLPKSWYRPSTHRWSWPTFVSLTYFYGWHLAKHIVFRLKHASTQDYSSNNSSLVILTFSLDLFLSNHSSQSYRYCCVARY